MDSGSSSESLQSEVAVRAPIKAPSNDNAIERIRDFARPVSLRDLSRILLREGNSTISLSNSLSVTQAQLNSERLRSESLEDQLQQFIQHLKVANEKRIKSEEETLRAKEELRLWQAQFGLAQREIERAQSIVTSLEHQVDDLQEDLRKAKVEMRRLNENRLIREAREEGRREGMRDGLEVGFEEGRRRGMQKGREMVERDEERKKEREGRERETLTRRSSASGAPMRRPRTSPGPGDDDQDIEPMLNFQPSAANPRPTVPPSNVTDHALPPHPVQLAPTLAPIPEQPSPTPSLPNGESSSRSRSMPAPHDMPSGASEPTPVIPMPQPAPAPDSTAARAQRRHRHSSVSSQSTTLSQLDLVTNGHRPASPDRLSVILESTSNPSGTATPNTLPQHGSQILSTFEPPQMMVPPAVTEPVPMPNGRLPSTSTSRQEPNSRTQMMPQAQHAHPPPAVGPIPNGHGRHVPQMPMPDSRSRDRATNGRAGGDRRTSLESDRSGSVQITVEAPSRPPSSSPNSPLSPRTPRRSYLRPTDVGRTPLDSKQAESQRHTPGVSAPPASQSFGRNPSMPYAVPAPIVPPPGSVSNNGLPWNFTPVGAPSPMLANSALHSGGSADQYYNSVPGMRVVPGQNPATTRGRKREDDDSSTSSLSTLTTPPLVRARSLSGGGAGRGAVEEYAVAPAPPGVIYPPAPGLAQTNTPSAFGRPKTLGTGSEYQRSPVPAPLNTPGGVVIPGLGRPKTPVAGLSQGFAPLPTPRAGAGLGLGRPTTPGTGLRRLEPDSGVSPAFGPRAGPNNGAAPGLGRPLTPGGGLGRPLSSLVDSQTARSPGFPMPHTPGSGGGFGMPRPTTPGLGLGRDNASMGGSEAGHRPNFAQLSTPRGSAGVGLGPYTIQRPTSSAVHPDTGPSAGFVPPPVTLRMGLGLGSTTPGGGGLGRPVIPDDDDTTSSEASPRGGAPVIPPPPEFWPTTPGRRASGLGPGAFGSSAPAVFPMPSPRVGESYPTAPTPPGVVYPTTPGRRMSQLGNASPAQGSVNWADHVVAPPSPVMGSPTMDFPEPSVNNGPVGGHTNPAGGNARGRGGKKGKGRKR